MKTQTTSILITLFITAVSFGQNTFPASGNVGIGTTSPTQKLQIDGGDLGITLGRITIGKPFATWNEGPRDWSIKADRSIAIKGGPSNVPTCLQIETEGTTGLLQLAHAGGNFFFQIKRKKEMLF